MSLRSRVTSLEQTAKGALQGDAPPTCPHVFAHDGPCVPGAPFNHDWAIRSLCPPELRPKPEASDEP